MSDTPKGRPPLEPRISALEAGLATAQQRLGIIERQLLAMNDSFSRGNIPAPQYEQQFKVWPGANPLTR